MVSGGHDLGHLNQIICLSGINDNRVPASQGDIFTEIMLTETIEFIETDGDLQYQVFRE